MRVCKIADVPDLSCLVRCLALLPTARMLTVRGPGRATPQILSLSSAGSSGNQVKVVAITWASCSVPSAEVAIEWLDP